MLRDKAFIFKLIGFADVDQLKTFFCTVCSQQLRRADNRQISLQDIAAYVTMFTGSLAME